MQNTTNVGVAEREEAGETLRLDSLGGQHLLIERGAAADLVTLVAADGVVTFSLRVTAEGPVLQFAGGLRIEANGCLALAGQRVAIRGAEGVSIESGADASIDVAGDLFSVARVQSIRARLGDVALKANDDVKVTGERILLNC